MNDTHRPRERAAASRTLTARCHCRSVHFTVTVPAASLPLPVHLCHCAHCRLTHGTLCTFHAPLPPGVQPVFVAPSSRAAALTGYCHARGLSTRYFCATCGCHVGDEDTTPPAEPPPAAAQPPEWRVATSLFAPPHAPDLFQIRSHCFTRRPRLPSETGDPDEADAPESASADTGLFDWLPRLGDRPLQVWNPTPEEMASVGFPPPVPWPRQPEYDATGRERLRAQCHCGGVSFTIPRPSAALQAAAAAQAADEASRGDERVAAELGRLVAPRLRHCDADGGGADRWVGCLDLCDDCRLVSGAHVVAWVTVPIAQTEPRVPVDLRRFGTLRSYDSSPGIRRAFCGTCGATVFWSDDAGERPRCGDERGRTVDLAVGVLRAPEGPLAERWLTWRTGRLFGLESGRRYDALFAESLRAGLDAWGWKRYGESPTFEGEAALA